MTNTALVVGYLPRLTPGDLLFAVLVFAAAICVLFNIRPVAILGATLLLLIITFVDLLGTSPFLALLIILLAAIIRLIGTAAGGEGNPELLATLVAIIAGDTTDPGDREDR